MSLSAIQVLLDRANAGGLDDPDDAATRSTARNPAPKGDFGDAVARSLERQFPSRAASAPMTPAPSHDVTADAFKPSAALDFGDRVALAFEKNFPKRNGGLNQ
jgi:hypothetical protein